MVFGLFESKRKLHYQRLDDVVWMTESARNAGLLLRISTLLEAGIPVVLTAHTMSGMARLRSALGADTPSLHILDSHRLAPAVLLPCLIPRKRLRLIFAEFGATLTADELLLQSINNPCLNALDVEFHTSLEAPALKNIITPALHAMMSKLGMQPEESITHPYITRAVANVRAKKQT